MPSYREGDAMDSKGTVHTSGVTSDVSRMSSSLGRAWMYVSRF